jgi:hypothetical protein
MAQRSGELPAGIGPVAEPHPAMVRPQRPSVSVRMSRAQAAAAAQWAKDTALHE